MRHIDDEERRARLGRRHGLAAGLPDVESATRAMTVLHATEAATVHLALRARVPGVTVADVETALYQERTVVKQLAMRRTLFVFPRDLLPAAWGSAAARVALQERSRLTRWAVDAGLTDDPETWIEALFADVLDALTDGVPRTTRELRARVPAMEGRLLLGKGTKWAGEFPVGGWVMTALGAEGRVVRATNAGHWRLNKPTWSRTDRWLGEVPAPWSADEGYAELVRRWLRTFGPGTETDIVWWLGATKTIVRRALGDVGAVPVALDGGGTGWVLAGDLDPVEPVEPWAALLPALDPTVMGWKERAFYLDPADAPFLFDTNGNAGHTAWWGGRVVGSWVQDAAGTVRLLLRRDVGLRAAAALAGEAERLTAWLGGVRVATSYPSPQMKHEVPR